MEVVDVNSVNHYWNISDNHSTD